MSTNSGGDSDDSSNGGSTFASVAKSSLPQGKNVLEVILEKDSKGSFAVSDIDCAKFLVKIGLDIKPGVQVDGVQICPGGRGVLFVTLKDSVDISQFSRYDVIDITSTGVRAVMIKPAGKREVIISVRGLHPNTSDTTVFNYLDKTPVYRINVKISRSFTSRLGEEQ